MTTTRIKMALFAALCLSLNVFAQYDDEYDIEEWTLDEEEEVAPKPQHKEYKNAFYLQYSPSRYKPGEELNRIRFDEMTVGYSRFIEVVEDMPYFVEVGANMKCSWETSILNARVLTFRIPVNVMYKWYLWKDKDYAIAPFAGASIRAIAMAREHMEAKSTSLLNGGGWNHFQVSWQTGVRFYLKRYFFGVSYSRDFRDSSKYPGVRECGVHFGVGF